VEAQTSWYKAKLVALDGFNQIKNHLHVEIVRKLENKV